MSSFLYNTIFHSWSSLATTLLSLLLASVTYSVWSKRKPPHYPPGPLLNKLPVFGSLFMVLRMPHMVLKRLGERYGPVFSLELGQTPVVVLNDAASIRHVLVEQGDAVTGRANDGIAKSLSLDFHGLILSDGDLWQEQRRFALQTMRNLGMGKNRLEQLVVGQAETMVERLAKEARTGSAFDPRPIFAQMAGSVVCILILGRAPDLEDESFATILKGFQVRVFVVAIERFTIKTSTSTRLWGSNFSEANRHCRGHFP